MLLQKRIFDWSRTLPVWQRDLLRRLTAGPLDDAGQREVLRILAGAPDAPSPVALELSDLSADEGEHGCVELRSVGDLRHVNCLAPEQTLSFRPGLNAVFGENGSGKSGYGRLIRRVTRSGEPEEILRDVFDPGIATGTQTACFEVTVDDVEQTIAIDLATEPARVLSAIAAFDASRARLVLSKPNVIEHVPRPLRLLRALSRTQDQLADTLRDHARQLSAGLPALPQVDSDTVAGQALAGVSTDTDVAALIAAVALSDAERATLTELEQAAAAIATDQSRQLEASARAQASGARSAARKLADAERQLPASIVAELGELGCRLDDISSGERALADRAFADQRLPGTGQGPWREMWFAAQRFAEANGAQFPAPEADRACPLCQQDLDAEAIRRLQRFQEFVESDLRQQATQLQRELNTRVEGLPDIAQLRATLEAELRSLPDEVVAAAGESLAVLDARLAAARKAAAGKVQPSGDDGIRLDALDVYARAQDAVAAQHASLRDEARQQSVNRELAELRARVAVVGARDVVGKHVTALRRLDRIEGAAAQLGTQRINTKLRELQQLAVTERLRKAIEEEVAELHPVASRVEISGQASKGETVVNLKLKAPCRAKIGTVLSDGEQRALSLAFFLAEAAVSEERSALLLDDPVSSLDHQRRGYLAQRLVEESRRRQVIVFTHDMAFMHMLQAAAKDADVELHGQTLQRAFHRVGMVADGLPTKMLGTSKRLTALRHRLRSELIPRHKRQEPSYEQEADRWVTDLRKAYDQMIEDTVLNDTVRRFSGHVQVQRLYGVRWSLPITQRIDRAMRKASPKAHHEALELQPTPHAPEQLEAMLDELASVYEELRGKSAGQPTEEPAAPPEAEPVVRAIQRQR